MDTISTKLYEGESMASTLISEPISLHNMLHVSLHARWTGAPTGDLYYEVSGEIGNPTVWEQYDSVSVAGSGTQYWIDRNTPYAWIRLRYVPSAGTGSMDADVVTKGDL